MTKEKAKRKSTADDNDRFAIANISASEHNEVSGYCRICSIYIFKAIISKEDSPSCIDCKRIENLCVILVEESGEPLELEKQKIAAEFDEGWYVRAKNGNDPLACSAIIDRLERLIETGIFDKTSS
jgi:hypothetical protein